MKNTNRVRAFMKFLVPWSGSASMATLWLCLWSASASPDGSQLRLEVDNVDWRVGPRVSYGVFDSGQYAQTVYFKVRLIGGPCQFFVTFGGTQGSERRAVHGGESIAYEVYDSALHRTALRDLPSATTGEVLQGTFGPGETFKQLSYVFLVPAEQVRSPGLYTQPIRITVYQGTRDNFVEKDAKIIVFSVPVDSAAEISVGEPGAIFDPTTKSHQLDFGGLAKGRAKGLDLRVRSNTGYHVTLESENGGVMKNSDPHHPASIPYTLQIGGVQINTGRAQQTILTRGKRLTDRNGDLHQLMFTIGQVGNAPAGTYQDNLTVTVVSDN